MRTTAILASSLLAATTFAQGFTGATGNGFAQLGMGVSATSAQQFRTAVSGYELSTGHGMAHWDFSTNGTFLTGTTLSTAGRSFTQAGAGGPSNTFFLAGSVIPNDSTTHEVLLIKLDASNNVVFTYTGSAPRDQQLLDVFPLADGGAIACGIDNSNGQHDALVLRVDAGGALLWSETIPGALDQEANAVAVSGSNVMVTGRQMNFGGTSDCYFAMLDLNGSVAWTTSWGGVGNETGEGIIVSSAGKFVVAGTTSRGVFDVTENRFKSGIHLWKVDDIGDTLWTAVLADTLFDRRGYAVALAPNGDLLIAGEREDLNLTDAVVLRTDNMGHLLWQKSYDVWHEDKLADIEALIDGFVACGSSFGPKSQQVLLIRKDENGD